MASPALYQVKEKSKEEKNFHKSRQKNNNNIG